MSGRRLGIAAALYGAASIFTIEVGWATELDRNTALLSARAVSQDRDLGLIVARGDVEIVRDGRVLLADVVTYNERQDIATASGNVSLLESTGEVLFANYMEIKDGLKTGVVDGLKIRLADDSKLAAARGSFVAKSEKKLERAVFSPCKLCAEDPRRAPLWQLKAREIVHDEKAQEIRYRDAVLELWGVPVFYTPYFAHADPNADKRSGFLAPTLGYDGDLGFVAQMPYFWNVAPNQDVTLTPFATSQERGGLITEYRHHLGDGIMTVAGSGTYVEKRDESGMKIGGDEGRGHIEGMGRFDIDNTWRWGFDVERATDRTYLRRYGFDSPTILTSRGFVEGFNERSYAAANTYFFQGLRVDDRLGDTPIVAPHVIIDHVGMPNSFGARWGFQGDLINIVRTESADTLRLSALGEWVLPHTFENGQIVTVTASVLGQVYHADKLADPMMPFGPSTKEFEYRIHPQLVVDWRYPWVRRSGSTQQIIEPVVAFVASLPDPNDGDFPSEDSDDLEFSDANLLAGNRFPGIDRFEGGQRVVYGLNAGIYGDGGGFTKVFVGQSFRFYGDTMFPEGSGLEDDLSDIVGRIHVQPLDRASVIARFRVDQDDLMLQRMEVESSFDFTPVRFGADYLQVAEIVGMSAFPERKEVYGWAEVDVGDNWLFRAEHRHDLTDMAGALSTKFGAFYEDECFRVGAAYERRNFADGEIVSDNRVFFSVGLKHLGSRSENERSDDR